MHAQLRDPERLVSLLRDIPFLNGGLFECLDDRVEIEGSSNTREIRVDGFSTDPAKQPRIPNYLFFGGDQTANLSAATGNSQRTAVKVTPLLEILNSFVWTITESTPLEEEVALDPDLLGNVFENLLASYNPETGTVARNATGSFYTPDYVVDWMIDQALEPLLLAALPSQSKKNAARLRRLLDWDEPGHDFTPDESRLLIDAISRLRALDPACGSGAYPMGLLKKMVRVLTKLDPGNRLWEQRQRQLAELIDSAPAREEALKAIDRAFARNHDDYGRKLYLIENSIYGVDIQPLAVQIAKLRFFITLIVDQPIDPALPNYGILPLPNLETKIVPANTLLGLQRGQLLLGSDEVRTLEHELKAVRHRYFTARRYQDKKALRRRDRELCKQLAKALVDSQECTPSDAKRLVEWNPYNTNTIDTRRVIICLIAPREAVHSASIRLESSDINAIESVRNRCFGDACRVFCRIKHSKSSDILNELPSENCNRRRCLHDVSADTPTRRRFIRLIATGSSVYNVEGCKENHLFFFGACGCG